MQIQNSYKENDRAHLYVVPTPIGNLEDMTFRAVNMLKEVDVILAEDTRHTKKLLHYFNIKNNLVSYNEHNHDERIHFVIKRLQAGEQLAIVSDAGMPAISDPGYELVRSVIKEGFPVIVLPGANAALCALVGSGLRTDQYCFYGFLPRKKSEKDKVLQSLRNERATIIFYESPYRIKNTVGAIYENLGNRNISIARELTKIHEQFIRGKTEDILHWLNDNELKGECSIVVSGALEKDIDDESNNWWEALSIEEHVKYYEEEKGVSHKEAMRSVANDRGISRRSVYEQIHVKRNG